MIRDDKFFYQGGYFTMSDNMIKPFTVGAYNGGYGQYDTQSPQSNPSNNIPTTYGQPSAQSPLQYQSTQQQTAHQQYIDYNQKIQMELYIAATKAKIQADKEIDVIREKAKIRAVERQQKKLEYDDISINPNDGSVCIKTKNHLFESPTIRVANFYFPEITMIHRLEEPDQEIYQFTCQIRQKNRHVLLSGKKSKRTSYLLKSLMSIGAQFMANTESIQKKYMDKLWTLLMLMDDSINELWIPDKNDWYRDRNGEIQFWEESFTWETISRQVY